MTATIVLTKTMLDKRIIDANASVREWALKEFGVDYTTLNKKVQVTALVNNQPTVVRFYKTTRGDRRISIKDIGGIGGIGTTIILTTIGE